MTDRFAIVRTFVTAAVCCLLAGGCVFSRSRSNEYIRSLDTSFIRIGETTRDDVLSRLGPPPMQTTAQKPENVFSQERLRYISYGENEFKFGNKTFLVFEFTWSDAQYERELAIDFDAQNRVTRVAWTHRDCIWKPFEGESCREPLLYREKKPQ